MTVYPTEDRFADGLTRLLHRKRLVDALVELEQRASNEELTSGFAEHREGTRTRIDALEEVFEQVDARTRSSITAN